ncbi:hypothetical protein Poli38472_008774 [Pythium oligandrum]|uniref:Glycoside hydrolase family 19 catalytic domain-containing protein n=1 Tax=Pythium oligandrum TaxID=41045 RepID=A0A8K1C468_PYTOL|nr:hypothetical protein Poli38472_008774 [Pythium oligandrum]|eukprot:TMW56126.1 hypothetical protein Poli38472_008774 [Pythium oligandrum]
MKTSIALLALASLATATNAVKCSVKPAPAPSNSTSVGFSQYFDEAKFKEVFPQALDFYTFKGLIDAAAKFPEFANTGVELDDKRELAAFFAQMGYESDSFKAAETYAKDKFPVTQFCDATKAPCAEGKRYHGRGPIMLSMNFNYYNAGKAIGQDLINNPELVSTDKAITWQAALWYWMSDQGAGAIHDTVAKDFSVSTQIMNGGQECGPDAPAKETEIKRIANYKAMCEKMGIEPVTKLSCNE